MVHTTQANSSTRVFKRGLVLQGGGAKGAFQYGVIRELYSAGIEFDVVSGTSVGALNCCLVASESWDIGDEIWSDLSLRRTFNWTGFGAIVTILSFPAILYDSWARQLADKSLSISIRHIFAAIGYFSPDLFVATLAIGFCRSENSKIPLLLLLFILGNHLMLVTAKATSRMVLIGGAILTGPISFSAVYILGIHPSRHACIWFALMACYLVSPALLIVAGIHNSARVTIFTNNPLRKVVSSVVRRGLKIPLFVTAAEEVSWVDPDDYGYFNAEGEESLVVAPEPEVEQGFCPCYSEINRLEVDDAINALLTSAALPFGIVPRSERFEAKGLFADGGVIDNTPWFPLVDQFACKEIVIVLCSPQESEQDLPTKKAWSARDRAIRVMRGGFRQPPAFIKGERVKHWPPTEIPFRDPPNWKNDEPKFILLAPSCSLGNFVTGTLNFGAGRAIRNLEMGRSVARLAISQGLFHSTDELLYQAADNSSIGRMEPTDRPPRTPE